MKRLRGSALLESALLLPVLLTLLTGTFELGRITYTYYMLEKIMANLARHLGTQQGVNFCNAEDATVQAAIQFALTADPAVTDSPLVAGLRPDMFSVRVERYDANSQLILACECSAAGCDASQGALPPGYLVVSLVEGYPMQPGVWGFSAQAFTLRPMVRFPYAGT